MLLSITIIAAPSTMCICVYAWVWVRMAANFWFRCVVKLWNSFEAFIAGGPNAYYIYIHWAWLILSPVAVTFDKELFGTSTSPPCARTHTNTQLLFVMFFCFKTNCESDEGKAYNARNKRNEEDDGKWYEDGNEGSDARQWSFFRTIFAEHEHRKKGAIISTKDKFVYTLYKILSQLWYRNNMKG